MQNATRSGSEDRNATDCNRSGFRRKFCFCGCHLRLFSLVFAPACLDRAHLAGGGLCRSRT
ncbi:MAG: hypothetical protein FP818_16615 [Rhodocyclaceae bacterium]|nr:hypothetical protein [Rhodocyclaceae bacterium]